MIYTITLSAECIVGCSHQGPCDEDVRAWLPRVPSIAAIPTDHLARFLREYGAWDAEELADDTANRRRILWLAACHCRETRERVFYVD